MSIHSSEHRPDAMIFDDVEQDQIENVVWYHANCLDGTCAAWVASHYMPAEHTTYVPMQYGDKEIMKRCAEAIGKKLFILDWMPEDMNTLALLIKECEQVILIDHHDSSIKKFDAWAASKGENDGNYTSLEVFLAHNNEWSGAMGTSIWFQENFPAATGSQYPNGLSEHWLVQAVDDRDRWQFKLPMTKEINEGLFYFGFDLEKWTKELFNGEKYYELISNGILLMQQRQGVVDQLIASGLQYIDDVEDNAFAAIINAPYYLASEIGNQIVQDPKFRVAIVWSIDKEYRTYFNFRSNAEYPNSIDCGQLAKMLGGGGHVNAAGAKVALPYSMAREKLEEALAQL